MKLNSFYDKKLPVSKEASSPMFVTNEVREQELMQQIRALEAKIEQYEESIIEHDRIRGEAKSDRIERERVTRQLEETLDTIQVQETALEPLDDLKEENRAYKERINGLESLNKSYVQGGVGIRTYIDLPELTSIKDSNYVIHRAELTIPYISRELDNIFPPPELLGLAAVNFEGNIEALIEDQNIQGEVYFDGSRNELTGTYSFNIARYVHKVIEEGYTNRLAIYVPSSVSQPERLMINNYFVDSIGVGLTLYVSN